MANYEKRLTDLFIRRTKQVGRHSDGPDGYGLGLRVREGRSGHLTKMFTQRCTIYGESCELTIGKYPVVTLEMAKDIARDNARKIALGEDPRDPPTPTFAEAADEVIDSRSAGYGEGSYKAKQWRESLRLHALPYIGNKQVEKITRRDIVKLLKPIWHSKHRTALLVKNRIKIIFDWCIAEGYRKDNAADDVVLMALPLVRQRPNHFPSVPHQNVEDFLVELRQIPNRSNYDEAAISALEFIASKAVRPGEGINMVWDEVDLDYVINNPKKGEKPITHPCWVIPEERSKTEREHVVPLTAQDVELLIEVYRFRDRHPNLVFPTRRGNALKEGTVGKVCSHITTGDPRYRNGVPHGFRSSFRSWCQDARVADDIAEICLSHVADKVTRAYARSNILEERAMVMQDWADYNSGKLSGRYRWTEGRPFVSAIVPERIEVLRELMQSNDHFRLIADVQSAFHAFEHASSAPYYTIPLRFMALTAAKTRHIIAARWVDIDMEAGVWTIPAELNRPLGLVVRVPLSKRALSLLEQVQFIRDDSELVFPPPKGRRISNASLPLMCRKLNVKITPVLFRTAFREWCIRSGVPVELINDALGRKRTEKLLPTSPPDTLKRRARLMTAWADFLSSTLPDDWRWRELRSR